MYAARFDADQAIRQAQCIWAMRDQDSGDFELTQRLMNAIFPGNIQVGSGLIQHQDGGLPMSPTKVSNCNRILLALESQQMDAYGKMLLLTPGMRLNAYLIIELRSALDWLLDPLLAAKRRQE